MSTPVMGTGSKIAAVFAIIPGFILGIFGVIGLFTGCRAHFILPPILGGLIILPAWAMTIVLIRYWSLSNKIESGRVFICPRCSESHELPFSSSCPSEIRCPYCDTHYSLSDGHTV